MHVLWKLSQGIESNLSAFGSCRGCKYGCQNMSQVNDDKSRIKVLIQLKEKFQCVTHGGKCKWIAEFKAQNRKTQISFLPWIGVVSLM